MSNNVRMYSITEGRFVDRVCYTEGTLETIPIGFRYGVFASAEPLTVGTGGWVCDNWVFRNYRTISVDYEFNKTGKFRYVKMEK